MRPLDLAIQNFWATWIGLTDPTQYICNSPPFTTGQKQISFPICFVYFQVFLEQQTMDIVQKLCTFSIILNVYRLTALENKPCRV
jgi:hypothetical protein